MMVDPLNPFLPLEEMVRQASEGAPTAPDAIREYLHQHPELAAHVGDVARLAEEAVIGLICGADPATTECLRQKLDQLRGELGKESDPPTMRLLCERVAANWLYLHYLDLVCSRMEEQPDGAKMSLLRKKETAQRLYLSSLKMQMTFRKSLDSVKATPAKRSKVSRNK